VSKPRIPRALWIKAESLTALGVDELAWRPEDAARVLEVLRPTEIAVLGGDVYVKHSGRFESSHENWYAERAPKEMPSAFAARSQAIAREYLENLMKSAAECWVTLVLSEPMDALAGDAPET
jgi:hypothetical protein